MVEYNLFWSLIYEINNPEIFNIVSGSKKIYIRGLLDPIVNTYQFDEEVLNKLINYLIHQNMMEDVIN